MTVDIKVSAPASLRDELRRCVDDYMSETLLAIPLDDWYFPDLFDSFNQWLRVSNDIPRVLRSAHHLLAEWLFICWSRPKRW